MKQSIGILLLVCLIFIACSNPINNNDNPTNPLVPAIPGNPENPAIPPHSGPDDTVLWFGDIYGKLIMRVGKISSEEYEDINDPSGVNGSQIVNYQYICNAINAKKNKRKFKSNYWNGKQSGGLRILVKNDRYGKYWFNFLWHKRFCY
jgi:hypothetical protein